MNALRSSGLFDCLYARFTSEVYSDKECIDARTSNSLEEDNWRVFVPRPMECLRFFIYTSKVYASNE